MKRTYPFAEFGANVSIDYSCEIRRCVSNRIQLGNNVSLAPDVWLSLPENYVGAPPAIILGDGCKIGRRSMITARNRVCLEEDVLLGPSVLIADHGHEFSDVDAPIHAQGLTAGGKILIERNCWLGYGAAVICSSGDLVVGRNSVVAANSVLTRSVPAFSVVAGNPAKIVKRYDFQSAKWIKEVQYTRG